MKSARGVNKPPSFSSFDSMSEEAEKLRAEKEAKEKWDIILKNKPTTQLADIIASVLELGAFSELKNIAARGIKESLLKSPEDAVLIASLRLINSFNFIEHEDPIEKLKLLCVIQILNQERKILPMANHFPPLEKAAAATFVEVFKTVCEPPPTMMDTALSALQQGKDAVKDGAELLAEGLFTVGQKVRNSFWRAATATVNNSLNPTPTSQPPKPKYNFLPTPTSEPKSERTEDSNSSPGNR